MSTKGKNVTEFIAVGDSYFILCALFFMLKLSIHRRRRFLLLTLKIALCNLNYSSPKAIPTFNFELCSLQFELVYRPQKLHHRLLNILYRRVA